MRVHEKEEFMKNRYWTVRAGMVTALIFVVTGTASAQDRTEIELTRQRIQTERQQLVAAGMELPDEQAAGF